MENKKVETSLSRREFVRQATFICGGILAYPVKTTASVIEDETFRAIFRTAVVGDSAMWGQGLRREDKFAEKAIVEIGRLLGRPTKMEINLAHSGAAISSSKKARVAFSLTNRQIFAGKVKYRTNRFVEENDQSYASNIYQEVPGTFPTISYQVESVEQTEADRISLVIMNGGINDLDFQEFLDPTNHRSDFKKYYNPILEEYFYLRVKSLIRQAREKFPNAVLIYTGYFSPFHPGVSNGDMKKLFYHLNGKQGYEIKINSLITHKDVDQLVLEAQHRAVFGLSRSLHFTKQAVIETMKDKSLLGPGILFVHPQFNAENAAFQPNSFFHNEYKLSEIKDPARRERDRNIVRNEVFDEMHQLRAGLKSLTHPVNFKPSALKLLEKIDAPESLMNALRDFISSPGNIRFKNKILSEIEPEMDRIINARRASFLHPNERGALRYSNVIVKRYMERVRNLDIDNDLQKFRKLTGRDQTEKTRQALRLYGLQEFAAHPAIIPQLMLVDCVGLEVVTDTDSEKNIADNIFLNLGNGHRWQLNFPYRFEVLLVQYPKSPSILDAQFRPGKTDFFTIDSLAMHLSEITQCTIERAKATNKTHALIGTGPLRLTKVNLYLNGIKVLSTGGGTLTRDKPIKLRYPIQGSSLS